MDKFANILRDLLDERQMDVKSFSKDLGEYSESMAHRWLKGKASIMLTSAVKIADFFDCSLDYLFGRSMDYKRCDFKELPPFHIQLRKILEEQGKTQYRLKVDKIVSGGNIDAWLCKKRTPHIESIIKLANYLNVSMDYLVGREK